MLKVEDLKLEKKELGYYGDCFCDYSGYHYICDVISEIADSNTSIYYSEIKDFICNNFDAVSDAIDEMGWDGCGSDLYKAGQMAEYLQIQSELYEHLDSIMFNFCINFILYELLQEEISENDLEKLQDKCENVDNNSTLDEFENFCRELYEIQEELV